jgi:hypothetical protein
MLAIASITVGIVATCIGTHMWYDLTLVHLVVYYICRLAWEVGTVERIRENINDKTFIGK